MAAPTETGDVMNEVLHNICSLVNDTLQRKAAHQSYCVRNKLRKKTRDLESGDIILPRGCLKLDDEECAQLLKDVQRSECRFICKVCQDKHYLLSIHLHRPAMYKAVLFEVNQRGSKFGHHTSNPQGTVLITSPAKKTESLLDLRCTILQDHVRKLLEVSGYKVQELKGKPVASEEYQVDRTRVVERVRQLAAVDEDLWSLTEGHDDPQSSGQRELERPQLVLNLRKVAERHQLVFGRDALDKNLDKVTVLDGSEVADVLTDALRLEKDILNCQVDPQCSRVIHLVPQSQHYRHQQIFLVYLAISTHPLKQHAYLSIGPVVAKAREGSALGQCPTDSAQEFCRVRLEQVKEAFEMRNGSDGDGTETEKRLVEVNTASINMDVLQNAAHVALHLDVSCCEDAAESRTGAFVVYNTARLATLLSHFRQEVEAGTYPDLPPVTDVDFSLLREQEEWELLYLYIGRYPELLDQAVELVTPKGGTLTARIHTHKVSTYLSAFSKCLSSYYSRYHILGGGEPHLLPRMFARLHLMKAAHLVLLNALDLIGVQALSYL